MPRQHDGRLKQPQWALTLSRCLCNRAALLALLLGLMLCTSFVFAAHHGGGGHLGGPTDWSREAVVERAPSARVGGAHGLGAAELVGAECQAAAAAAVLQLDAKGGHGADGGHASRLLQVEAGSKQVVAGVLWKLRLRLNRGGSVRSWKVSVLDQAWSTPRYTLNEGHAL